MPREPRLEVVGLRHRMGPDFELWIDALSLGPGVHLLTGANGAGKTTLLRILATLVRPAEGKVDVAGHDVVRCGRAVRARVGYAGHAPSLHASLSVETNLKLHAHLHGQGRDAVDAASDTWGLSSFVAKPVARLSAGQARRADLARACLHDPPVLLLDEPFSGLDEEANRQVRTMLATRDDRLVLVAAHASPPFAATTTLHLTNGRLTEATP